MTKTFETGIVATIKMVWAQERRGGIGLNNQMPWYLPEDFQHFKNLTTGHTVIMGRKTYQALPNKFRPLPNRNNIVISRNHLSQVTKQIETEGADVMTYYEVLKLLNSNDYTNKTVYIIGGTSIYSTFMNLSTQLIVTEIDADFTVDTYAPTIAPEFNITSTTEWKTSRTGLKWRVVQYEK